MPPGERQATKLVGMIGFCGSGNMARAIVTGLINGGTVEASEIVVSGTGGTAEALASDTGARPAGSNAELLEAVGDDGILVLAVKPHIIPLVLDEIGEKVPSGALVISIAAGTSLDSLASRLPAEQRIIRVMPNVNAQIGAGMAGVCGNEHTGEADLEKALTIFEAVGRAAVIEEDDFSAYSALAGCSPAFVFEFIEALARGGLEAGLTKADAVEYAAQAVLGSAKMVLERADEGMSPANLRDLVTSPGGTTIAGVAAMEQQGFGAAVVSGVRAAIQRDKEL